MISVRISSGHGFSRAVEKTEACGWSSAAGHYEMNVPPQGLKPQERQAQFGTTEAVP
jgi:hypothetical protein